MSLAQNGLIASDFTQYNVVTNTFGTAHPNFAGDPITLGLGQISFVTGNVANSMQEVDYDNLRYVINAADGGGTSFLLLPSLLLLFLLDRRHRLHRC